MPQVNPQIAEILALLATIGEGRPKRVEGSPREARAQMSATFEALWNADRPVLWAVYNEVVPGPGGPMRVRLYDPGVARPAPCLVYLHGGGWVIGSLDTHDGACRRLAAAGGFLVLAVDYRLAPEHKCSAGLEDAVAAVRFAAAAGAAFGIDPERLAIGGDSAGANLALAACMALRDSATPIVKAALLVYGAYAFDHDTASHRAFGDGSYVLSSADMAWFWSHYLNDPASERRQPLAAPLHGALRHLPPLLVTAAELDPLRDDSERLAARLVEAGAPHDHVLWPGVTHACLHMTSRLEVAQRYIEDCAAWLGARLDAPGPGA